MRLALLLALVLSASLVSAPIVAGQTIPAPTLEAIMALHDLGTLEGGITLSPDGSRVAVVEYATDLARNDVRAALVVAPVDGASPATFVGDGGGLVLYDDAGRHNGGKIERWPLWSPDGRWIAYLAERNGRVELWRSSGDGRWREPIIAPAGDVRDFAWVSASRIAFNTATPRDALAAQHSREDNTGFRVDDRFDAGYALRPHPNTRAEESWRTIDLDTGVVAPASPVERALGTDATTGIPRTVNLSDRMVRVRARDLASSVSEPSLGVYLTRPEKAAALCPAPECSGALLAAGVLDQKRAWFARTEGFARAKTGLYVWETETNTVRRLRLEDERLLGCVGAHKVIVCLQETPKQPRRLIAIDGTTGTVRVLYDPNPHWRSEDLPRVEEIDYRDDHGLESFAHLVYPSDYVSGRAFPMVIVQYRSRGFLRGGVGGEYPIFPLAARGYFVLSVDRPEPHAMAERMSDDALERVLEIDGEEKRMKLASLNGLIQIVVQRGLVDEARIAITGMSDGAETLYWALGDRPYAAAVASSPPTDPLHWSLMPETRRDDLRRLGIAAPWPNATTRDLHWWRANATLYDAERLTTPLMMNLPESEAVFGMPLQARLRELGVPVDTYIYPGAYHLKWRPSQVLAAQERALAWIDFWLQNRVDTDPNDAGRTERWTALRAAAHSRRLNTGGLRS